MFGTRFLGKFSLAIAVAAIGSCFAFASAAIAAPSVVINSPSDASVFATDDVTVDFTATPGGTGMTVTCSLNGFEIDTNCSSPKLLADMADGTHVVDVTATDSSGTTTASVSFDVDAAAPVLTFFPEGEPIYTTTPDISYSFSADDPSTTFVCQLDSDPPVACDDSPGNGLFESFGVASGNHELVITATDDEDRVSTYTRHINVNPTLESGAIRVDVKPSTTVAGRHPDIVVDMRNTTDQDLKNLSLRLPGGLAGSLKSVNDRCDFPPSTLLDYSVHHEDAEIEAWCPGRADAKIGEALVEAQVDDSTTRLRGNVYLTDGSQPGEPAGIAVLLEAEISNLDLGNVVIPARLNVRITDPGSPIDIGVNPAGVDSTIDNLPDSLATENHGLTEFTLRRARIHLSSTTLTGVPLFTNPSSCSATEDDGTTRQFLSTGQTHQGGELVYASPYQSTDCDYQPVGASSTLQFFTGGSPGSRGVDGFTVTPGSMGTAVPSPTSATAYGVRTTLDLDQGSTTIKRATVDLPGSIVQREAGIGVKCTQIQVRANPPTCADSNTRVGWFVAETPLLDEPVVGSIFIVSSGNPLPWIYLYYKDADLGVELRMRGKAVVNSSPVDRIRVDFNTDQSNNPRNIPDLPVESIELNIPGSTGQGHIMQVNSSCQPYDSGSFLLESHTERLAVGLIPASFSSCNTSRVLAADPTTTFVGGGPDGSGGVTEDTTPTFNFSVTGADALPAPTFDCAIETASGIDGSTYSPPVPDYRIGTTGTTLTPCNSGTFTPSTPLREGIHVFRVNYHYSVGGLVQPEFIKKSIFEVRNAPTPPVAPPVASITSTPHGTTDDTTPSFTYESDVAGVAFECRVDSDAFQPCDGDGDSGSLTFTEGLEIGTHTFQVRARDADNSDGLTGDVGAADSETFTIDVPFGPTFDYTLTSTSGSPTQARAHPELEVTITSNSNDDLKFVNFAMPKGFVGSLLGAVTRCSVSDVNAHTCPATSKVGTLTASAKVDLSDVKVPGEVFLTDPLVAGDPAGLLVRIQSKVGSIELDDVYLRQRLVVRGNAEGINAVALDPAPNKIISPLDNNAEIFFHFRKLELKLTGTPGATQKLITNPSDCSASSFDATFTSYEAPYGGNETTNSSQPFQATGCETLPFYTGFAASIEKYQTGGEPTAGDVTRFTATVAASPDDAGVKSARLELPVSLTATSDGLPLGCTVAQYESTKTCEPSQVIGSATATTPLLPGPISGNVYLGQPKPGSQVIPGFDETLRVIIQLRGLVNVDLVGKTTLIPYSIPGKPNGSQTLTVFDNVPDAPITSFTATVDKLVRVQPKACGDYLAYRSVTGSAVAHNGKTSAYNSDVGIRCSGDKLRGLNASIGGRGKKARARIRANTDGSTKITSFTLTMPKGVTPVKRQFKKKFVTYADKKKLRQCAKLKGSKITSNLCGRKTVSLDLRFNPGALNMPKKLKKVRFKLLAKFENGGSQTVTIELSGKSLTKLKVIR